MVLGQHAVGSTPFGSSGDVPAWPLGSAAFITVTTGETTVEVVEDAAIYWFRPGFVIPGYSSDGTNISIPIASVIGLTSAEADAVTGDWREILQAILLRAVEYHKTWNWSDQMRTYEPFVLNLLNSRTFDRRFLIHFVVNMGEPNVAPEP